MNTNSYLFFQLIVFCVTILVGSKMASSNCILNKEKRSEFIQADNRLTEILANNQQQSALHMTKVDAVASQLIAILDNNFGIGRFIAMGPTGSRTSTTSSALPKHCSDLDLIVFFNFSVLCDEKLQDLVSKLPKIMVDKIRPYQTLFSATAYPSIGMVKVVNPSTQVAIDVHVAVNLACDPEVQWKEVLNRYVRASGSGTNLTYLNTSHLEKVKIYMTQARKDSFVEQVVQLAQMWNENCVENLGLILHPIPGRNRILELVAIKAAQKETQLNGSNRSMTSALQLFLTYLKTPYRNLQIVFVQGVRLPQSCQAKFDDQAKKTGILLDPVNPYVNYLDNLSLRSQWPGIQGAAQVSLNCLELVRKGNKSMDDLLGLKGGKGAILK